MAFNGKHPTTDIMTTTIDHSTTTIVPKKPITFYTSRTTPACRAVKMVATHLNLPLNEIALRCYIDTRTEKFKKINPCHTLPVIDDDGYILWESRAIMQYLCNQYAPNSNLYPSDPQKRATIDRLLNFDLKTLSHAVMAVHYEFMFPSEFSTSRGEKFIAVTNALTLLEIFLINKNYVACEHLTIADISILASVTILEIAVEFDLSSYPNIWLWINRLRRELPYYESLTKMAHDELRALIQNVRDAHDEWSSPVSKCAFTPNGSDHSNCIEEQRRQYQRLFSKGNTERDAQRIMAVVFQSNPTKLAHQSDQCQIKNTGRFKQTNYHENFIQQGTSVNSNSEVNSNQFDDPTQFINTKKRSSAFNNYEVNHILIDNGTNKPTNPLIKRIRLTIEPNTGQSFQLNHLESSIIQ